MNIVVTGGSGFIGSAILWRLNELGREDIVVVDRRDDVAKEKNLAPLKVAEFVDADEFISRLDDFEQAEAIIHMGACSSTTETNREYMMRNNYQYTRDLAEFAVRHDIRFIYASSAATYGDGSAGMADGTENLDKLRPLNLYGESKHLFDQHAAESGMFERIVGLKYFNVFGPNEDHKGDMRSLVNKAFGQINETGKLQLFRSANPNYADGEFGRDFVYVKDAVDMTLHFLGIEMLDTATGPFWHKQRASVARTSQPTDVRATDTRGGLFNVGSGEMHTWNALADAIFNALGREPNIEYIDMPEVLRDKYQYHTRADIARIRQAGYLGEITPLEATVNDYVRNYLMPDKHLGEV
ncbi:MAG: ADP-glyceromanno-heptose 6-epimerase [Pyrinomonadaceae bacterium]